MQIDIDRMLIYEQQMKKYGAIHNWQRLNECTIHTLSG